MLQETAVAVELMRFLTCSRRQGYVYEADPEVASLSLDQFDMYVRQIVDGNRACLQAASR